jgi:hypothetical protein
MLTLPPLPESAGQGMQLNSSLPQSGTFRISTLLCHSVLSPIIRSSVEVKADVGSTVTALVGMRAARICV